ncbi:MAG: hypothetical protein GQ469_05630 [Methanosarcinales archaeon]|nr:hypothetical protein [Methanosarcinales archaeon]
MTPSHTPYFALLPPTIFIWLRCSCTHPAAPPAQPHSLRPDALRYRRWHRMLLGAAGVDMAVEIYNL